MAREVIKRKIQVVPEPAVESTLTVDEQIFEQVKLAVHCAEEKKAEEIVVLKLVDLTEFTDFFVICSGNSTRQVQAIADEVIDQLKRVKVRPLHTEGYQSGEWILIDYGAFVIHVFVDQARKFYDLERLWRDAERIGVGSRP